MINTRLIAITSLAFILGGSIATLVFIGNGAVINVALARERSNLSILDNRYDEMHAQYLDVVLDRLSSETEREGFVALERVRYIEPQAVVGFVSRGLSE